MLLAPQLPAIAARPAATILLLRDLPAGQGFEVLMTRRSEHARFASNAYVFPGGGIEAQDEEAGHHALALTEAHRGATPRPDAWLLSQALAGIR